MLGILQYNVMSKGNARMTDETPKQEISILLDCFLHIHSTIYILKKKIRAIYSLKNNILENCS